MSTITTYTLLFDSWEARWEAIKALDDYTVLVRCDCNRFRRVGLRCAACGREPTLEEIPEEEPPSEANRAACPPPPLSRSSP